MLACLVMERLSTGVKALDEMLAGGIPRGFSVAVTGEPGTGKTILCIHFTAQGISEGDRCIYVTTEESRDSIITQAEQFGFDFSKAVGEGKLIIIDALMGLEDQWTIRSLSVEELVNKVIEAKKALGYGRARLVIDSLSAFWLDKPAMSRRHSYFVKKVLAKWDFTILATSQYAITTSLLYDEPVIVRINGEVQIVPIGELVDRIMVEPSAKIIEVASLDWRDFKVKWMNAGVGIKHRYTGKIYRLKIEGGREISVTKDHSLFIIRDRNINCLPTSEIKTEDYVLVPIRLPNPSTGINNIGQLSCQDVFSGYDVYFYDVSDENINNPRLKQIIMKKYKKGHDTTRWCWRKCRTYPLKVLNDGEKFTLSEKGEDIVIRLGMLSKLVSGDVGFMKVREIKVEDLQESFVYDISVPGAENFVAGFGGVICHNSEAFGWGIEHIADGIIRFRRAVRDGVLRRFLLVEKMRQTPHSLQMHEISIVDGKGLVILGPLEMRREDIALPRRAMERIKKASEKMDAALR